MGQCKREAADGGRKILYPQEIEEGMIADCDEQGKLSH